ncbi:MAG: hypothetical protein DWQ08_05150 [Proteobacteria bacterium]|nr:MAG: hypothetical protein DWQ08_05150 [Pseudomonadota bacterium]
MGEKSEDRGESGEDFTHEQLEAFERAESAAIEHAATVRRVFAAALTAVLTGFPAYADLIPDLDHDCLHLEQNEEARFEDMARASELKRTAWAYTREYAERFLMPERNIESLVGAAHSRYVVRQDVNLICETGGDCWPMNHCQFELYVPVEAEALAGRAPDSYQDPMWGDRMARYLSPVDPADVRYMNDRRESMRYRGMYYEVRAQGAWRRVGGMQLIGYRKSISDELDALVLEGDCAWYRDAPGEPARIVLEEPRDGGEWRHEIELPASYLERVSGETRKRAWPSVDAYGWWWADTWWPQEGYRIGYDERFSEAGARGEGEPYWIWDSHVWDVTEEFAARFGMPQREEVLTARRGGLEGAYAMSSLIGCKGLQDGLINPYTTRHGYRAENLHADLDYVYYCEGGQNAVYEFYLPYGELEAMGVEAMGLAEQKTWMPMDVLRGWRRGEKPIERCRHPDFDELIWGHKYLSSSWLQQVFDWFGEKTYQGGNGKISRISVDTRILPKTWTYLANKYALNISTENIVRYMYYSIQELSPPGEGEERLMQWVESVRKTEHDFAKVATKHAVQEVGRTEQYSVVRISDEFRDKHFANEPKWQNVLDRVAAIAESVRKGSKNKQ